MQIAWIFQRKKFGPDYECKHIADVKRRRDYHADVVEIHKRNVRGVRLDFDGKIASFLETLGPMPVSCAGDTVDEPSLDLGVPIAASASVESRVSILEAKMEEVEKFLFKHNSKEEWEIMKKEFPHLFKK